MRIVVVKGSGKGFCAGIDLDEYPGKDEAAYRDWTERMERPFLTIAGMGKPVIAQVHGIAAANGAGLAAAALGLGLVNRVVPEADLERETRELAASLARKSPVAMMVAKKAFYAAEDMDYRTAFEYMNEAFALLCSTEDAAEGVEALRAKRAPSWTGK